MTGFYIPLFLSLPIAISLVAPFFDVPALKKSGDLVYYSPLFLAEKPKDGRIRVHGGTLFDYVFVLDRSLNGRKRKNLILQLYLAGLSQMIDQLRANKTENLTVLGTSYIINERTAKKLGFQVVQTDFLHRCILIYNYFNLLCASSMANGKLTFPKLGEIQTFEAELDGLLERREFIKGLEEKIKQSQLD